MGCRSRAVNKPGGSRCRSWLPKRDAGTNMRMEKSARAVFSVVLTGRGISEVHPEVDGMRLLLNPFRLVLSSLSEILLPRYGAHLTRRRTLEVFLRRMLIVAVLRDSKGRPRNSDARLAAAFRIATHPEALRAQAHSTPGRAWTSRSPSHPYIPCLCGTQPACQQRAGRGGPPRPVL